MHERKTTLPWWGKALVALLLLVIVAAGSLYLLGVNATSGWKRYVAELQAGGSPLRFADIEASRVDLPDHQNGARVLLDIFKGAPEPNENLWKKWGVAGGKSPEEAEHVHKIVAENAELLDELQRMRDFTRGRFDIAYTGNPFDIRCPEWSVVRRATELAYNAAVAELLDDNPSGMLDWIEVQANVAGTLNEHPTLFGYLTQDRSDTYLTALGQRLLDAAVLSDADLQRFSAIVRRRHDDRSLKYPILGERAYVAGACDAVLRGDAELAQVYSLSSGGPNPPWLPDFVIRMNQRAAVEGLTHLVEVIDDPAALRAAAARNDALYQETKLYNLLTGNLVAHFSHIVDQHFRGQAQLDALRVGLAADRYYLDHDRYPDAFSDLVPTYLDAIPTDPFSDKPLRMTHTEDGIVVYSVDSDGVDDGGDVGFRTNWKEAGDRGVRLLLPEKRGIETVRTQPDEGA